MSFVLKGSCYLLRQACYDALTMNSGLQRVVLLVPIFLFSLCVHEFAHAWVATKRGDPTAKLMGRLTLHPLAHADWIGTFFLPIVCIYYGWPFFGWAKPVPVDTRYFKHGRRDMALVAAAGPISNILLALIATGVLALLIRVPLEHSVVETMQLFAVIAIQVNLMLAFFNLIPIPPLDGFMVIQGILSARVATTFSRLAPHANLILFILLFSGGLRFIATPVYRIFHALVGFAGAQ